MTQIQYLPLATDMVRALQAGGPDAYGNPAERVISEGSDNPCRHCLHPVPQRAGMLIVAHRPFDSLQPYAETGPIFLCAGECTAWSGEGMPPILQSSPDYLLKGYTANQRIRYGTGKVVTREAISDYASELLARDEIAFVDVRSARNNCFQLRITRST